MKQGVINNIKEVYIPTKFGKFLCVFESNKPEAGFTVISPAARGFVTSGRSLQEAKKMAKEGLEFHCECELFEHLADRNINIRQKITV